MTDKKLEIKRIIIFILFSYGLSWGFSGVCDLFGILQDDAGFNMTTELAMLTPAAGSLLTRLVTKEGMADSLLRLNFKGNGKYYLLGIAIPIIYGFISALLSVPVIGAEISFDFYREAGISGVGYVAAIFLNMSVSIALFPFFLGEELGWRGYLFPKLKKVMGRPAAHIVGGIIWGLWHIPSVIDGLNFGKDYEGYPYVGIIFMCISCIGTGIIFTWLTEKTDSVYPAVLAHGVNNNVTSLIYAVSINDGNAMQNLFLNTAGVYVVALFCILNTLYTKNKSREKISAA